MNDLRFCIRLLGVLCWVLAGLLLVVISFSWIGLRGRLAVKQWLSKMLLHICGLRVSRIGQPVLDGPVLWVANHVSWLDIFILNCVRATVCIAKSEIKHWPLIGWLVWGVDTIFIERASRHAVHKAGAEMQQRFACQQVVGLFPEGTTSSGFSVLPFYANLFEPARKAGVPIQPVALRFYHHGKRSDFVAFVGEQTLLQNLRKVLGGTGVSVEIAFLPVIWDGTAPAPVRAELSRQARQLIDEAVQ